MSHSWPVWQCIHVPLFQLLKSLLRALEKNGRKLTWWNFWIWGISRGDGLYCRARHGRVFLEMDISFAENVGINDLSIGHIDSKFLRYILIVRSIGQNELNILYLVSLHPGCIYYSAADSAGGSSSSQLISSCGLYGMFILASSTLSWSTFDQCSMSHFGSFTSHTLSLPFDISRSGS